MNARLYDPVVERFLSPDPYVQNPYFSQSFNRYSYCWNNPLKYSDQNGEFFWSIINGFKDFMKNTFWNSWSQGFNAWSKSENWHSTSMAWKVDTGLFSGNFKQIVSRFTWKLTQTVFGYATAGSMVTVNYAKDVSYWGGATAVETYAGNWGGFTLGSYIMGGRGLRADPNNSLFQHEYGHYLQSQAWGPAFMSRAAIPSFLDTFGKKGDHKFHPIEQDANMRAFKYFNKNVGSFYESTAESRQYSGKGWDFYNNPLDIYGNGYQSYVDYRDSNQMKLLNDLKVNPSVLDYIPGLTIPYGIRNHVHYNKHKYTID